jgi:glycosyltransferase involved in cell wall biosynthesis
MRRYRTYYYTDLTPSLMRELAPWYDHKLDRGRVTRLLRHSAHQAAFNALRGVFAMSEWAASGVRRDYGLPTQRVHVTLPGANLRRWQFVDRGDRSAARPIRILMVGGEFRLKGGELLLEWARRTTSRNWELDIVTWPGALPAWIQERLGPIAPDTHACRSLEPELPTVRVHVGLRANTDALTELFTQADIFCLPTQADGSSIASLEAMATGLPVLVGAVGGIPELIDDGTTGFLIRRGDASHLASTLETLLADRSLRLAAGQAARRACVDRLNTERQLREILAVIDREGSTRPS